MVETLVGRADFEKEIKKSRFLAMALPIETEEAAMAFIRDVSHPDATHNCWAWKIGSRYRSDDAGEPGGTAGRPILQVIEAQGLDKVAVVVTRWFGGVKLGAGGLLRAYGGTAAECLRLAERVEVIERTRLAFHCPFSDLALVGSRLPALDAVVESEEFDATGAAYIVAVPAQQVEDVTHRLADMTSGRIMATEEKD
ncbi:MAG: YigZ family protein [Acetobacter aceti]|uniref:Thymidylate synthase n=1 Tax=Acetobacter aceti TaxID=435 RepID=A0A1U9KEY1_ACEAC|nr:YigZ family protein [Acetobacter aceti]AQS84336.1 thymidylate synthase [Acetobacter aceti]